MSAKVKGFTLQPEGVRIHLPRVTVFLTFAEVGHLFDFMASGERASTDYLRRTVSTARADE